MRVVGADGCRGGWAVIELEEGRFRSARFSPTFIEIPRRLSDAQIIGVDIPIGLPDGGYRAADLEARAFLGGSSSVFPTAPRSVLEASTYADALARSQELNQRGLSRQSYGTQKKNP